MPIFDEEATIRAFAAAIEPLAAVLDDVVVHTARIREALEFTPAQGSPAALELEENETLSGAWSTYPVTDAHANIWLFFIIVEDLIGSTLTLARDRATHVYSPAVLARSALEAAARCSWLSEPKIGARQRVSRWATEQLYSAAEEHRLLGDASNALERRSSILESAERHGFSKRTRKGKPPAVEEDRPSATVLFRKLFGEEDDFGAALFSFWSAIAHSTFYGVFNAVDAAAARKAGPPDNGPLVRVGVVADAVSLRLVLVSLVLGYHRMALTLRDLFGWGDEDWRKSLNNALRLARDVAHADRQA